MMLSQAQLQWNSLVVQSSINLNTLRRTLDESGYYDKSRCIKKVNLLTPTNLESTLKDQESFAIPITQTCVEYIEGASCLPPPFTDCKLAHLELPSSKKAEAELKKPYRVLKESLRVFLERVNETYSPDDIVNLLLCVPSSWERHGDLVVLPQMSFRDPRWRPFLENQTHSPSSPQMDKPHDVPTSVDLSCEELPTLSAKLPKRTGDYISPKGETLLDVVASALKCKRLAIDQNITCDSYRSSGALLLLGNDGWVEHVDNGVTYVFDVTKCMFSSGNISEKLRVASFDCRGETVIDLYAGIGYFTLPYLVHTGAAMVHACEWNPNAVEALRRGLEANKVGDRCIMHQGDNRKCALNRIADRVNLGLVPSSEGGWSVACGALKNSTGGWLHIHGNVSSKSKTTGMSEKVPESASVECNPWEMTKQTPTSVASSLSPQDNDPSKPPLSAQDHTSSKPPLNASNCSSMDTRTLRETSSGSDKVMTKSTTKLRHDVWREWAEYVAGKIVEVLKRENPQDPQNGKVWRIAIGHIEHVKSYAPHIDHVVVDLECRPIAQ